MSEDIQKLTYEQKLVKRAETLRNRIQKDTEEYNETVAELNNIAALANLSVGEAVRVTLGRAETKRVVEGSIVGVNTLDSGAKQYRVVYGSGFDTDVAVVAGSAIVEILNVGTTNAIVNGAPTA